MKGRILKVLAAVLVVVGVAAAQPQGDFNLTTGVGNGVGYSVNHNFIIINDNANITFTGTSIGTGIGNWLISIEGNAKITLQNVVMESGGSPIKIQNNNDVTLTLVGENTIASGSIGGGAGIMLMTNTVLTIDGTGSLTVRGGAGSAGIGGEDYRNIIINSGTITATGGNGAAGIGGNSNNTVDRITINGGTITATGGERGAGIGGGEGRNGGIININGGTITAIGGREGAGIGGGRQSTGGNNININGGTITAYGYDGGAGIGGGNNGNGANVTISGGFVKAYARNRNDWDLNLGSGIGRGLNGTAGGTFAMSGNAIVFAGSISDTNNDRKTGGILLINIDNDQHGNSGFFGNEVTINQDIEMYYHNLGIQHGQTLTIASGVTLTIPDYSLLENGGTIKNFGNIVIERYGLDNQEVIYNFGTIDGEVIGGGEVIDMSVHIDLSNDLPDHSTVNYIFANNVYTILDNEVLIEITGDSPNQRRIEVAANAKASIMLVDVSITQLRENQSPILLNSGAELTLLLSSGTNLLAGGSDGAAIRVPAGATLTISDRSRHDGSLHANGGSSSAGIGGGLNQAAGNIIINGGFIRATGHGGANGIGGGANALSAGTLTMNGNAIVFANSIGDTDVSRKTNGILFIGNNGSVYGNVMLFDNFTIPSTPSTHTLTIPSGATININGRTLTNNGVINGCGSITGGTVSGNRPVFHIFDEWKVTTEPTYAAEGEQTEMCVCGALGTATRPMDKLSYTINLPDVCLVYDNTDKRFATLEFVGTSTVTLTENEHFTAEYTNNRNAGTASVKITGIGDRSYIDTTIVFTITRRDVAVIWGETRLEWHGELQAPTATSSDARFPVQVTPASRGMDRNTPGLPYTATAILTESNPNINLTNTTTTFNIVHRTIRVEWEGEEPRRLVFNRMPQAPRPTAIMDFGDGRTESIRLRINDAPWQVGRYYDHLAPIAMVSDERIRSNVFLSNNSIDYEIVRRPLNVVLRDERGNVTDRIQTEEQIRRSGALFDYIENILGFDNFATDTLNRITDDRSVLNGRPRFGIRSSNDNSRSLRSDIILDRNINLSIGERFLVAVITEDITAENYTVLERNIMVTITERFLVLTTDIRDDDPTSIADNKEANNRGGIRFTGNPVSDKVEISVVLPGGERIAEMNVVIYDMTGNVVWAVTARRDPTVWDLRNSAGRIVANGTYLVIAEVKDRNGRTHRYSARLGVKR